MTKYDEMYLNMALEAAKTSTAKRLKVGCVLVKDHNIVSMGMNGTPKGWYTNSCECEHGVTRDETIHSEMNALMKAARDGRPTKGTTLYCTHSPCPNCAKHIIAAGVIEVIYLNDYRDTQGIQMLMKGGVKCLKFSLR